MKRKKTELIKLSKIPKKYEKSILIIQQMGKYQWNNEYFHEKCTEKINKIILQMASINDSTVHFKWWTKKKIASFVNRTMAVHGLCRPHCQSKNMANV